MQQHPLPKEPQARERVLERLYRNLCLRYPQTEAQAYAEEIRQRGSYNEAQRRFGIHYSASDMCETGHAILMGMENCGCDPLGMEKKRERL